MNTIRRILRKLISRARYQSTVGRKYSEPRKNALEQIKIQNRHTVRVTVIVEPWAHEYYVKPGAVLEVFAIGEQYGHPLEINYYSETIVVYAWSSEYNALLNGEQATPFEE